MNAVDIKELSFSYKDVEVFNGLNLSIDKNSFTTILGRASTGKSTLFKILSGELKYSGKVSILNKSIFYNLEKNYLGLVSTSIYNFKEKTARKELVRILELEERISLSRIDMEINKVSKKLGIKNILDYDVRTLSVKEKILLMFAIQIINRPKVLILDNVLSYLDDEKDIIIKELLRLNRKNVTIINITNDTEECMFGSNVVVLDNIIRTFKIAQMTEEDFLDNELNVPFMVSLSSKLNFYGLIEKKYLKMEKLVDDLWQ